jgi:hypothetical protein
MMLKSFKLSKPLQRFLSLCQNVPSSDSVLYEYPPELPAVDTPLARRNWLLWKCNKLVPIEDVVDEKEEKVPLDPVPSYMAGRFGEFVVDVDQADHISDCISIHPPTSKYNQPIIPLSSPGTFIFSDVEFPNFFNLNLSYKLEHGTKMMIAADAFCFINQLTRALLKRVLWACQNTMNDDMLYKDIKVTANDHTCWRRNGTVIVNKSARDAMLGVGKKYRCQLLPIYLTTTSLRYSEVISQITFWLCEISLTD